METTRTRPIPNTQTKPTKQLADTSLNFAKLFQLPDCSGNRHRVDYHFFVPNLANEGKPSD